MKLQAALATLLIAPSVLADADRNITGADILNFALNLECLEAEFYSWAVYGKGVDAQIASMGSDSPMSEDPANDTPTQDDCNDEKTCKVPRMADLNPVSGPGQQQMGTRELAKEIADDEIAHVVLLREALGTDAIECPTMNVGSAFTAALNAAAKNDMDLPQDGRLYFNPYFSDVKFLHGAFLFEDVGVTAYAGAVPALSALVDSATLGVAAKILAAEAYHAGVVRDRLIIASAQGQNQNVGVSAPIDTLIGLISELRDTADGDGDLDQGIQTGEGDEETVNYIPTDEATGLVFARTVPQVLKIVYLGGETKGGFFPEGIKGVFGEWTPKETKAKLAQLSAQIEAGDSACGGSAAATDPAVDSTTEGEDEDDNAAPSAPRGAAAAAAGAAALLAAVVFG